MKNIMVVGCGGVGSRHLQSLAKIDLPVNLYAVDPDENSLKNSKKLFDEIPQNHNIKQVNFLKEFPKDVLKFDLCIIATSSNVRLKVLKNVITNFTIKNLILEKVLFQSIEELDEADKIIDQKKINCWVNCYRREEKCWINIKKFFENNSNSKLYYGNADWSMCCNTIHIVDLAVWLFDSKVEQIENKDIENKIYTSKRDGFIEFNGILNGFLKNGTKLKLESNNKIPFENVEFEIVTDTRKLRVNEAKGEGFLSRKETNWIPEKFSFHIPYQSEKTHKIAKKILETEKCNLTTLKESVEIHKPILLSFLNHLNKISDKKYSYCPIT